jgi:hypothetical protein
MDQLVDRYSYSSLGQRRTGVRSNTADRPADSRPQRINACHLRPSGAVVHLWTMYAQIHDDRSLGGRVGVFAVIAAKAGSILIRLGDLLGNMDSRVRTNAVLA